MKKAFLFLIAILGISHASATVGDAKLMAISEVSEATNLLLDHTSEYQNMNEHIELARHYSHSSHVSHASHSSHSSHYSSY